MCYKVPYGEPKFDHNIFKYTTEYILNLDRYGQHLFAFVIDMSTFYDKKNYTISLHMVKYCLEKGLKLKKIHYVIYAEQSDFMKLYIFLNHEKRSECSINNIFVEFFKLMSNSNSGKQIENVTKYKDTRIANNAHKAKKMASKVTLNDSHILSKLITLCEMKKSTVLLDKPIIIRFTTLEIAKLQMNFY